MYIVEITEDKLDNIVDHMAKGIKYFNKAIECLDEVRQESHQEPRHEARYGGRYNDDYDDEEERRYSRDNNRRRDIGRYSRY